MNVEITIRKRVTDDDLISILCGATSTACAGWVVQLDWDDESYSKAREMLINSGHKESDICLEDVLLQLLKNGDQITFYDAETEEAYSLSLYMLFSGIESYMNSEYCETMDIDDWDDTDYDAVIQYAFFGELAFG